MKKMFNKQKVTDLVSYLLGFPTDNDYFCLFKEIKNNSVI